MQRLIMSPRARGAGRRTWHLIHGDARMTVKRMALSVSETSVSSSRKSNLLCLDCLIDVTGDCEPRLSFGPAAFLGFLGRRLAGSRRFVNSKVFQLCARLQLFPQPDGLCPSSCPRIP